MLHLIVKRQLQETERILTSQEKHIFTRITMMLEMIQVVTAVAKEIIESIATLITRKLLEITMMISFSMEVSILTQAFNFYMRLELWLTNSASSIYWIYKI